MSFIFMDESGDLGFDFSKKKTSNYFVITFLITDNRRGIEKLVRRIFAGFSKGQVRAHDGMLHAYKESSHTRQKLLHELAKRDIAILTICLNKKKVFAHLQNKKQVVYNYVTNILLDRLMTLKLVPRQQTVILIASRRETNKFMNENFKQYLASKLATNHKLKVKIEIKTPQQEKALQVVDMTCWAMFRKWEHHDESYYQLIKSAVIEENPLFP